MSITKKAIVFLVLTFVVSWTALILGWNNAHRDSASAGISGLIYVLGPAVGAVFCTLAFERGHRTEALGLQFRPNWWWLGALLIPVGITIVSIVVTTSVSRHHLQDIEGMARQMAELRQQNYSEPRSYLIASIGHIGMAIIGGTLFSTLTEELGWRGYLHHLWRPFGFWRSSLAIGFIWGIWHWPLIYLFGLNYPDHRLLGLVLFPIFTMLEAPIMTLLRDCGRSVWAAGICHGTINAILVLTMVVVNAPKFPWDTVGIGSSAAFGIGILIIAIVRRVAPNLYSQERDNRPRCTFATGSLARHSE